MNELNMIRALLDEAPPSAEVMAEGRLRIAAGTTRPRRHRARWGLTWAGLAVATLAAVITLAVTLGTFGPGPGVPGPRKAFFGPASTASGVLRNAALAVQLAGGAPLPGQFVYTKLYVYQQATGAGVQQTWSSADGTRLGLQEVRGTQESGGRRVPYSAKAALPACRDGFWYEQPNGQPPSESKMRCSAAENAAYLPAMPTSPAALRGYLNKHFGLDPGDSGGLLTNIESMMITDYLTPAQRAALYRLMAQTPGLVVVPHATNMRGHTGVGVRSGLYKDSIYTIIFSRTTYAPLGMNWTGVAGPMKATRNGEILLKAAIVNQAGQLP